MYVFGCTYICTRNNYRYCICFMKWVKHRFVNLSTFCGNQSHMSVHWPVRVPWTTDVCESRCRDYTPISCVRRGASWDQIRTVSKDLCGRVRHGFVVIFLFVSNLALAPRFHLRQLWLQDRLVLGALHGQGHNSPLISCLVLLIFFPDGFQQRC